MKKQATTIVIIENSLDSKSLNIFTVRKILIFCFAAVFLISCDNKKDFKYVEIVNKESLSGQKELKEVDAITIKATNDTTAYLEAYKTFCISLKVNQDMLQSNNKTYSTPVSFKVYNEKNVDITNITFNRKEELEKEIKEKMFALKNSIEPINEDGISGKVDSAKIKELEKYFRKKTDEFSNSNKVYYEPKSAPLYTNSNGLYCYFQTTNGLPSVLRFRLQYYADDWLFFNTIQFLIDGKAFDYIPENTERDSGNGYIWEWFDQGLSESEKELIYALANAKTAKMKLTGKQYYKVKTISQDQINGIKRTLELYNAIGGKY